MKPFNSTDTIPLPRLQPTNLAEIDPSVFSDRDLDPHDGFKHSQWMPYYLEHLPRLANAILDQGPYRGFIDIAVWRGAANNHPREARIMENILSLIYFYTQRPEWNPYYGDEALRLRLEAAINYWLAIQDPRHPEADAVNARSPVVQAFSAKFMSRGFEFLKGALERGGPVIDPMLLARLVEQQRRNIVESLAEPEFSRRTASFSNQLPNGTAAAAGWIKRHPQDLEIAEMLDERLDTFGRLGQSGAGFFWEADHPDWAYNLGTHRSNTTMLFEYLGDTPRARTLIEEQRRFYEWMDYNSVPAPDGGGVLLNSGICLRNDTPFTPHFRDTMAKHIPEAWPFMVSEEEKQGLRRERR